MLQTWKSDEMESRVDPFRRGEHKLWMCGQPRSEGESDPAERATDGFELRPGPLRVDVIDGDG